MTKSEAATPDTPGSLHDHDLAAYRKQNLAGILTVLLRFGQEHDDTLRLLLAIPASAASKICRTHVRMFMQNLVPHF